MVKYLISFKFHYSDISILGELGFTLQVIFENYLKFPRAFWPQGVYSTALSSEWLCEYGSVEKSCVESNASLQRTFKMLSKPHFQYLTPAIVRPLVTSARNPSLPCINNVTYVTRLTIFNAQTTIHIYYLLAHLSLQSLLYTSQDVLNRHAQIITSCYTIQNVE